MVKVLTALVLSMIVRSKGTMDLVPATVVSTTEDVVTIEIEENGEFDLYSFYGDGFVVGDELVVVMAGDEIIGVR